MIEDARFEAVRAALADRYRVEGEIGRGGMATVYLAEDLKHPRQVAIKVLKPELAALLGPERFLREIAIASQLSHPHIVPLHDSGEAEHLLYYVMPYIEGESLRQRLARDRHLSIEEAVRITREVAEALSTAHAQGIIHRDVKPANILLRAGHAMVADFGLARAISTAAGESFTSSSVVAGTPGYMSPEQASGDRELDARTDVYSLGCVVYEMLAGEPPYTGPSPQAILAKQLSQPVPPLSVLRETIPSALEETVRRALARVPADRFDTPLAFAASLEQAVGTPPARGPGLDRSPARAVVLTLGTLAVVTAALATVVWRGNPRRSGPGTAAAETTAPVPVGVLPPEVRGHGGEDPGMASLVQQLFAAELTRNRGLAVVDPLSLNGRLEAAREEPGAGADPIAVLRGWGIRYALGTTVTEAGGTIDLGYVLTDTQNGSVVETGTISNRDQSRLPAQIRQAGDRLQDALESTAGAVTKALDIEPWISNAPSNVAAVQAFIQGTEYAYRGMAGGREYYQRALELDPGFIAPRVWLVSSLIAAGDTAAARSQVRTLDSLKDRATPFEQAMIGWSVSVVAGDLQAKANHLRVALSYSPRNNVLLYQLGDVLAALGRFEEAVEPVRLALDSRWRFVPLYTLWGRVAVLTGRLAGLRQTLDQARSLTPQRPELAGLLEALDLFEGDARAAERDGAWYRSQLSETPMDHSLRDLAVVYRALARRAREGGYPERATLLSRRAANAESGRP